jgi:UDP-N-acetylglucosamine:LPS N-acetylglucosamine transferase
MKICLAASAGGHLNQLLSISEIWKDKDFFFVTSLDVAAQNLKNQGRVYITGECNREHLIKTLGILWKSFWIVLQERPNVVISTGAAPGFLMCFWGKLFGARVIWLDSIANACKLSMSGQMIRPFADLMLSQWPDISAKYPKVQYVGEVI